MNKAAIYARVSSTGDRQDTARQVADLQKYAAASGLEVVKVFEEKASGAKDDREVLADCLAFLHAGSADTLLLTELSRLGRPVGLGMTDGELLEKYPEIVKYLKKGLTVRDAAAASQKSTYTVQKVKKAMKPA